MRKNHEYAVGDLVVFKRKNGEKQVAVVIKIDNESALTKWNDEINQRFGFKNVKFSELRMHKQYSHWNQMTRSIFKTISAIFLTLTPVRIVFLLLLSFFANGIFSNYAEMSVAFNRDLKSYFWSPTPATVWRAFLQTLEDLFKSLSNILGHSIAELGQAALSILFSFNFFQYFLLLTLLFKLFSFARILFKV
jgi:hypothetical protein